VSYRTQATVPTDSPAALRTLYPAQRASFSPSERVIIATSATRERVPERQGDPRRTSTAETVRRGRCHLAATLLDPTSLPDGESPCGAVEPGRRTAGTSRSRRRGRRWSPRAPWTPHEPRTRPSRLRRAT